MCSPDRDILEKITMVVPVKKVAKSGSNDMERSIQGNKHKSISPRAQTLEKRRSVLGDLNYGPGSEPHWKAGSACYLAFYKALL